MDSLVNRKAWKLLRGSFPKQVWLGCMAHEVSLLMGDIVKIAEVNMMHHANHALVKWVNNKPGILKLFRDEVGKYFDLKATGQEMM